MTSQLFANVYLNELDQFVQHKLKIRPYLRYCDDFIIVHQHADYLNGLVSAINGFLEDNLSLTVHPEKVIVKKLFQGIDFLGYVTLPYYVVLRTKTKRRLFREIRRNKKEFETGLITEETFDRSLYSYLGVLKHCKSKKMLSKVEQIIS